MSSISFIPTKDMLVELLFRVTNEPVYNKELRSLYTKLADEITNEVEPVNEEV